MFGNRRANVKMRHLVKQRIEKLERESQSLLLAAEKLKHQEILEEADAFRSSRGWFHIWNACFQVSSTTDLIGASPYR